MTVEGNFSGPILVGSTGTIGGITFTAGGEKMGVTNLNIKLNYTGEEQRSIISNCTIGNVMKAGGISPSSDTAFFTEKTKFTVNAGVSVSESVKCEFGDPEVNLSEYEWSLDLVEVKGLDSFQEPKCSITGNKAVCETEAPEPPVPAVEETDPVEGVVVVAPEPEVTISTEPDPIVVKDEEETETQSSIGEKEIVIVEEGNEESKPELELLPTDTKEVVPNASGSVEELVTAKDSEETDDGINVASKSQVSDVTTSKVSVVDSESEKPQDSNQNTSDKEENIDKEDQNEEVLEGEEEGNKVEENKTIIQRVRITVVNFFEGIRKRLFSF